MPEVNRDAWLKDKVKIRFHNLERRGEAHSFTVNGEQFYLEHGKVVVVPRAVVSALNDAIKTNWKVEGSRNTPPVPFEEKRFLCEIIEETVKEVSKEDAFLEELVAEKQDEKKPKKKAESVNDLDADI